MGEQKFSFVESLFVFPVTVIVTALIMFIAVPFGLLSAWIRVQLWNWFVVPYLHLPSVSVWVMFGIGIFISNLRYRPSEKKKSDEEKAPWWESFRVLGIGLGVEFVGLGLGYVVHRWIL